MPPTPPRISDHIVLQLTTGFAFSYVTGGILLIFFVGGYIVRRDRPKMQFFLSDLMLCVLSIALCATMILAAVNYIANVSMGAGISSGEFSRHFTPLQAFCSSLLWFLVGFFWTLTYQSKLKRRNPHAVYIGVIFCFVGNAVWIAATATNLMGIIGAVSLTPAPDP